MRQNNSSRQWLFWSGCCLLLFFSTSVDAKKHSRELYTYWKPLDLVRGLRQLSMDPFDVFRTLEAVKDLESDDALDFMRDINIRPITIYDALDDLAYDPFDAYYALKAWLTDPELRDPDDPESRVNVTGDPRHPYLHVTYKTTTKDGKPVRNVEAKYLTSDEVDDELDKMEVDYKKSINKDKFRMSDFIKRAKRIHSAFDDPRKVFRDFFGKRHFKEWKELFPDAFSGLKNIYRNPLGDGLRSAAKKVANATGNATEAAGGKAESHGSAYKHAHSGGLFRDRDMDISPWWRKSSRKLDQRGHDAFDDPNFNDPKRYEKLKDETNVEEENTPLKSGQKGMKKTHHVKRYFDKLTNMYVDCKKTEECEETEHGVVRRVKTFVQHVGVTPAPPANQTTA